MKRSELSVGQIVEGKYGYQLEVLDTGTWIKRRHSSWRDDYRITLANGDEVPHDGQRSNTGKGGVLTRTPGSAVALVTRLGDLNPVGTYAASQAAARQAREDYEARAVAKRQALVEAVGARFGNRTGEIFHKYHLNRPLRFMDHEDERVLEALTERD